MKPNIMIIIVEFVAPGLEIPIIILATIYKIAVVKLASIVINPK